MRTTKSILAGFIVVVVIVFASSVFAQGPSTQPTATQQIKPKVIQTDPNQTLRELQAAEDRKMASRKQAIKAEILKLEQKKIELEKTKKPEICTSPKINKVYPTTEVFPGTPVWIEGCAFGNTQGKVKISQFNRDLIIESWADRKIKGMIPEDLAGFADPKQVTLQVITQQGAQSNPSTSILLGPKWEIKILETKPVVGQGTGGGCKDELYASNSIFHSSHGTECKGVDTIIQAMEFKNRWIFYNSKITQFCVNYNTGEEQCGMSVRTSQRPEPFNNLISRSSIPKLEIEWVCNKGWYLSYRVDLFIKGPVGTNYK